MERNSDRTRTWAEILLWLVGMSFFGIVGLSRFLQGGDLLWLLSGSLGVLGFVLISALAWKKFKHRGS